MQDAEQTQSTPETLWTLVAEYVEDPAALEYIEALAFISQTFDDLYDRDRPVTGEDFYRLLRVTLIAIPSSPFFEAHKGYLLPVLSQALLDWRFSNTVEKNPGDRSRMEVARVLRSAVTPILRAVVLLLRGERAAVEFMYRAAPLIYDQSVEDYIAEFRTENTHGMRGQAEQPPGAG